MKIFDSTLQDGERAAPNRLDPARKASIATSLEALGVDVIDAGFPGASQHDREGTQAIAAATHDVELSVLARHIPQDIEAAWEAVRKQIDRVRLATWVMPCELHSGHQNDPHVHRRIMELSRQAVSRGRSLFPIVQYYLVCSGDRDIDFLIDLAREVVYAGADCVTIADSMSSMNPEQTAALTSDIRAALPAEVELSVRCHNNMGLALSNSVAAVHAGADQVEVTVGGIGDAGGNAALEQVLAYADCFEKQNPRFANNCQLQQLHEVAAELFQQTNSQYGSAQPRIAADTNAPTPDIRHSLTQSIRCSTLSPNRIGRLRNCGVESYSGVPRICK